MMVKKNASILVIALLTGAAAIGCRPNQSLEGQANDAKIATAIKSKLVAQVSPGTLTGVDVNVTNGVVTLAGPVHSAEESSRIESVARSVEGVKDVKNTLQVMAEMVVTASAPIPPALTPPAR